MTDRQESFAFLAWVVLLIVVLTGQYTMLAQHEQQRAIRSHAHVCVRAMEFYDAGNPGRCK